MPKIVKKYGKITLILGLILILLIAYLLIPEGQAATITSRSITISDSRPDQTGVTYDFAGTHSATTVMCLDIQFCTTATGTCILPTGMSVTLASATSTGWNEWDYTNGAGWSEGFATTDTGFRYISATGEGGGSAYSFSATDITNPSATSTAFARVATYTNTGCSTPSGGQDSGVAAFAILSGVTVSATVVETLSTSINGVATADCPDFDNTAGNEVATTYDTVPYSTINTETFYDACQDTRVATNANTGYSMTVSKTQLLTCSDASACGSNAIADGTCDGTCSTTAEADWATATLNGFGYCMDDQATYGDASATADAGWGTNGCGNADTYFKLFGTLNSNAQNIMQSAVAVSDDRSFIGYRLSVDTSQQAGPYQTTIVFITTPTY
jgi:hypothetical protein